MESFIPARFDIFDIYRQYCDIMSGSYACGNEECLLDLDLHNERHSRESLNQLLKLAESRSWTRISVYEEIYKLMSRLDLLANNAEFSRFYDFVFFICRENGQKSITVSRAVMAWRLVLAGRFSLLNDWCEYVEQNQRYNISEDTWRQILTFSCFVKDNLEGYDPEGAWPVLVDDFVQHLYRYRSYNNVLDSFGKCGLIDGQQPLVVVPPPGAGCSNMVGGVKRKFEEQNESVDDIACCNNVTFNKGNTTFDGSPSPCHVEGCLSKGFSGLFSRRSRMRC